MNQSSQSNSKIIDNQSDWGSTPDPAGNAATPPPPIRPICKMVFSCIS